QVAYTSSCENVAFNRRGLFCAGNYVYGPKGQLAYTSSCEDVVFSRRNRLFCAGNYLYTFEGQQRQYVSSCKEIKV
ncbi:MAG TPA: hypothetical protein PL182_01360, partial [Pseudobdellovibrionaceae bacterium]|nr:hypothetical protein [Pseudobdellovibrionaceae bacterium]